jgi:hypothetical protein
MTPPSRSFRPPSGADMAIVVLNSGFPGQSCSPGRRVTQKVTRTAVSDEKIVGSRTRPFGDCPPAHARSTRTALTFVA